MASSSGRHEVGDSPDVWFSSSRPRSGRTHRRRWAEGDPFARPHQQRYEINPGTPKPVTPLGQLVDNKTQQATGRLNATLSSTHCAHTRQLDRLFSPTTRRRVRELLSGQYPRSSSASATRAARRCLADSRFSRGWPPDHDAALHARSFAVDPRIGHDQYAAAYYFLTTRGLRHNSRRRRAITSSRVGVTPGAT